MKFLLDTNTCIRVLTNSSPTLTARWTTMHASQIRLCSPVKAELWFGAAKSTKRDQVEQRLKVFCARFRSMPFDDFAAMTYGHIRSHLEAQGTPIGPVDLLIASIALSYQLVLVTHNTSEFRRVPNLEVEDWEANPA